MPGDLIIWAAYLFFLYFVIFWLLVYVDTNLNERVIRRKNNSFLSIAIPAYNEEGSLKRTVNSVLNLDYPKEKFEVVIINDGSRDKTREVAEKIIKENKRFNIILINQENKGKGEAMNAALEIAKGEFFITLDADSFVKPDAANRLLGSFNDENVAAVLPIIKVADEKGFWGKLQYCEYLINFFLKKVYGSMDCIHVTPGPFAVYKTEILKKLGGFDKDNLTEDQEMAMRLQKYNYKIKQAWSTDVLTLTPKSLSQFYRQRNRWYKGTIYNVIKYKDILFNRKYGEYGLFFLPSIFVVALVSIAYSIYMLYNYVLGPALERLYNYSFINYDIALMVETGLRRFTFLDFNYSFLFFGITILVLTTAWIILSHKHTGEKFLRKNALLSSFLYLTVYPPIIALVWLGVFVDLVRKKKQKW